LVPNLILNRIYLYKLKIAELIAKGEIIEGCFGIIFATSLEQENPSNKSLGACFKLF